MCDERHVCTLDCDEAIYGPAAAEMVRLLIARGIRDRRVLGVMRSVPRHLFVREHLRSRAYADEALRTLNDQTISQPYMVAAMTEALGAGAGHHVLEIGTGSGYQTMVLARLGGVVVSIERDAQLAEQARRALAELGVTNVTVHVGDGTLGWGDGAPYDRIIVTAGGPRVPEALTEQLGEGGRLVMPVGDRHLQNLMLLCRDGGSFSRRVLMPCQFVPLVGEQGW